jgi:hypothetical protein
MVFETWTVKRGAKSLYWLGYPEQHSQVFNLIVFSVKQLSHSSLLPKA